MYNENVSDLQTKTKDEKQMKKIITMIVVAISMVGVSDDNLIKLWKEIKGCEATPSYLTTLRQGKKVNPADAKKCDKRNGLREELKTIGSDADLIECRRVFVMTKSGGAKCVGRGFALFSTNKNDVAFKTLGAGNVLQVPKGYRMDCLKDDKFEGVRFCPEGWLLVR